MNNENEMEVYDGRAAELQRRTASEEAQVASAVQTVQAALIIAQRFKRNETESWEKIMVACQRRSLAESAEYEYTRGGTKITGPSIDLLRAIAKRWGNIAFGWAEVDRRNGVGGSPGESSVLCYAWDQQSNVRSEISVKVRHWRDTKQGGYPLKDERDIYEMLANQAARRVRACIEAVIDADIVESAVDACRKTLSTGNKDPLIDRIRAMAAAFGQLGVTVDMIEARFGHKIEAISESQLAGLRRIYTSIKDGVGKREDFFTPTGVVTSDDESATAASKADKLTARLAKPKPATPPPPDFEVKPTPPDAGCKSEKVQDQLADFMEGAGVTFDQFADWLKVNGYITDTMRSELSGYVDLPSDICEKIKANASALAKIAKTFGKAK